jgi:hypothetical protein
MASALRIPRAYINWAKAMIETFWNKPLDKCQRPPLSKAQIRQQILSGIERMQIEDGDPATWTPCAHCDETGMYLKEGADHEELCYQCTGKGRQSEADRKRNWGYQKRRQEAF